MGRHYSTNAATDVGDDTTTLNGFLTGLGTDTSAVVSFEYGTDTSYGTTIAADQSPMSATGSFSCTLTSLTNGQEYHFRATATGSTTVYGSDATFTTDGGTIAPTTPSNLQATAVSSSQINLTWQDNSTNEEGFRIEHKTGTHNFTELTTLAANTTSYSATGLTPTTTYCYKVSAYNSYGDSNYSDESCANTATIVVLSADGEGTDTNGSYYGGNTDYTNINSDDDDTSYWRGNVSQCYKSWTWQNTDLPPGSTINSVTMYTKGRSSSGWTTPQLYCRAPGRYLQAANGQIGSPYITVSYTWSTNPATGAAWTSSEVDGAEFGIYVPSGNVYPQNYTYVYLVVDYFPGGPDPTSLVTTTISSSQINLRWADNCYNEEGFRIERKTGTNDFEPIATVAANNTTYSDTGLFPDTQYCYRVRAAYNAGGDSDYSNEACDTTYPPLTITTDSLPYGILFAPYSATLQATGGTENYAWYIISGSLPDGFSLTTSTGVISGITFFTGTFNFTVQVEDDFDTATQPLSITVNPPPTPIIGYSPTSFSFDATEDGPNPPDQILSIWNSGDGTLNWSVSDDAAWLSLSPTSGSSTGETYTVTVSVDISNVDDGTSHAYITISDPGAPNTPQEVQVTLTVNP